MSTARTFILVDLETSYLEQAMDRSGVHPRTGVLVKSAKRCADGDSSIAKASIVAHIGSDASDFMATPWR